MFSLEWNADGVGRRIWDMRGMPGAKGRGAFARTPKPGGTAMETGGEARENAPKPLVFLDSRRFAKRRTLEQLPFQHKARSLG